MYLCDCVYLAGLGEGGGGGGGGGGEGYRMGSCEPPMIPPLALSLSTSPPPVPVLRSEPRLSGAGGAESGGRTEGEILLICVEFYYFQLFGS